MGKAEGKNDDGGEGDAGNGFRLVAPRGNRKGDAGEQDRIHGYGQPVPRAVLEDVDEELGLAGDQEQTRNDSIEPDVRVGHVSSPRRSVEWWHARDSPPCRRSRLRRDLRT